MKKKDHLVKRYIIFLVGLFFVAFGIAFITKATLGTSPIASIPYTLSLIIPRLTLGNWTIIFNYLFVLCQLLILGKEANKVELVLQLVLTLLFGYCIDFGMWILTPLAPVAYAHKITALIVGCFIMAFGVYLEVLGGVVMLPGDSFVGTISKVSGWSFGNVRFATDVIWVVISGILCMAFLGALIGVREGTVIAALLTGNIVKLYARVFRSLEEKLLPPPKKEPYQRDHLIITISREFGSGGHSIGKMVAERLGIGFYDMELIQQVARESGYSEDFVMRHDQKRADREWFSYYWYKAETEEDADRLFAIEADVIRGIAKKGPCVIVGRSANYILRNEKRLLNVFIKADLDDEAHRVEEREGVSHQQAKDRVSMVNREREDYCKHYTGQKWGKIDNYDLVLNSSERGIDRCVDIICETSKQIKEIKFRELNNKWKYHR